MNQLRALAQHPGQVLLVGRDPEGQRLEGELPGDTGDGEGAIQLVGGNGNPDRRHAPAGAVADREVDLGRSGDGLEPGDGRREGQRHLLLDARSPGDRVGPRQGERPEIGLERGIEPVAMIFGLPGPTLHPARRLDARKWFMGNGTHIEEALDRVDEVGKHRLVDPAVGVFDAGGTADHLLQRMEHDEAGAAGLEVAVGSGFGGEHDPGPDRSFDAAPPHQRLVVGRRRAVGRKGDGERVLLLLYLQIADVGNHGRPVAVADQKVETADHLHSLQANPPQRSAGVDRIDRTGGEPNLLIQGFGGPVYGEQPVGQRSFPYVTRGARTRGIAWRRRACLAWQPLGIAGARTVNTR